MFAEEVCGYERSDPPELMRAAEPQQQWYKPPKHARYEDDRYGNHRRTFETTVPPFQHELDRVMSEVQVWCDKHDWALIVTYNIENAFRPESGFWVEICSEHGASEHTDPDLRIALMRATILAARAVKEQPHAD